MRKLLDYKHTYETRGILPPFCGNGEPRYGMNLGWLSLSLGDILSKICRRCNIGRELRIIDW